VPVAGPGRTRENSYRVLSTMHAGLPDGSARIVYANTWIAQDDPLAELQPHQVAPIPPLPTKLKG
jgi:hypothetical protein